MQLHTTQNVAEQIADEIKKNLLPVLKKNSLKKISPAPNPSKAEPTSETIGAPTKEVEQKSMPRKKLPAMDQIKEPSEIKKESSNIRKNDAYIEPIE